MESNIKENEHFQSQFKAYQEQQQKRLRNLMEKKEKQNGQKGDNGNTKETFRIPNDLNLFEAGQPLKEDGGKRFLEVENKQLQDQLREVRDENCRLYKLLTDKDFEIKQLRKKIQEDRLALTGASGLAGDVAATKIVELAKKNREITAEAETEKAKVKQLNNRVKELERELQTAVEKMHCLGGDAGIKQSTLKMIEGNLAESPEVKALQEKLTAANFKVMEYRNQLQSAKQELKMTQKVLLQDAVCVWDPVQELLANEVGEDVNIQSLLTNSGSWRGRAQQILVLQSKVRELENQLGQSKTRKSPSKVDEELLAVIDPRKLSAQEKNLLKIRSLEKEKKETLEKLTGEYDVLKKSHEEVKKTLDASKARNKVLCSEVKTLKGQIVILLEKGKHDNELIDALLAQQKQMQEILKHLSHQDEENKESKHMLGQNLNSEVQKQNCLIEQLRQVVTEREAMVKELEEEIGQLTLQLKSAYEGDSLGAAEPPPSESSDSGSTLLKPVASGSNQVGRTGSARTVSKMGHTLVESAATFHLSNNITPGRLAGANSLDLKVLQTQITEHKALCQAAEVERDRLLELVTVLQKRVEESSNKILAAEKSLQEERQRCVILEQQLEKLQMDAGSDTSEQKSPMRSKTGQTVSHSRLTLDVSDSKEFSAAQLSKLPIELKVEELSRRLAMQLNENKSLKAALETALRKKEEDFKLYQDTMGQVKDIFLQAIQQQK
ncbi:coiled-coil domain-containing protein 13 isoform X1 [Pezoporus wallicus]|uniref:coiled-coil domain-containing protein 13 isoform X1 n=1 Tax=Pezoporus wallicus TaxID=35540 RepID=UPI00254D2ACD|nr:coiled-coil domain-containing protein 13 isoform X1 [Pezoporus wallicus]XP_057254894.1 coiled-coil domain-containing protein 13 isoform X1 [Pezoporus wallicus]